MAFAKATLDATNGYVYENDSSGNCTAIVFTGVIWDGTPDANNNLLDAEQNVINPNWQWHGAMRLEGADLTALPAANPQTDGTPQDPRYQAIFAWLAAKIKAQYDAYAAIKAAETTLTPRPAAEVAALPAITSLPA